MPGKDRRSRPQLIEIKSYIPRLNRIEEAGVDWIKE
jgi:hypothetical protein